MCQVRRNSFKKRQTIEFSLETLLRQHQATKLYEIEVSDSADFNPSMDVLVAKGDKRSIQVSKSSKRHKAQRIGETRASSGDSLRLPDESGGKRPGEPLDDNFDYLYGT